jgi:hypothetical protein
MKKAIYSLDFLSISGLFHNTKAPENMEVLPENSTIKYGEILLKLTRRRTQNFKFIWDIEINNLIVAEIRTNPNKSFLHENAAIIKFNNELLYNENLNALYQKIKKQLGFQFIKINQIDIALDQVEDKETNQHIKFAYDFIRGKTNFVGNQTIRIDMQKQHIRDIYIGQRNSHKFLRCYYKKRELQRSNKTYILDYWRKNKLEHDDKEVFRSELSLRGSVINEIEIKDLANNGGNYQPFFDENIISIVQSNEFLNSVFRSETKKFCSTVKISEYLQKAKDASRCAQNYIFEHLDLTEPILLLSRLKADAAKMVHKIKMTCKFLEQIFAETNQDAYRMLSDNIAAFEGLLHWKMQKEKDWIQEHKRKLDNPLYKRYMGSFKSGYFKYVPFTDFQINY